jgi:heat shock protein 4
VDKERVFTQAQVVSMMLSNLKKIAVADHKSEVTDCVIGVPVDWTEEQRNTVLDAAELAGLKCLSLINEVMHALFQIRV